MTDYMQQARALAESEPFQDGDWSMERLHRRVHARTLEALDTERAAHEATKAELQALRVAADRCILIVERYNRRQNEKVEDVKLILRQALTRKDA